VNHGNEKRDLRLFLQETYLRRLARNPRYSLRSYARALGLNSGTLSQLLSGKRPLSAKTRDRLLGRLDLGAEEYLQFVAPGLTPASASENSDFRQISLDTFQVMAEWYHFAILELIGLASFRPDPKWMARKLGITPAEAGFAVERLERLGFLEIRGGKWRNAAGNLSTAGNDFSAAALKKLQHRFLEMARSALDEVPYERRDQSTLTLKVDATRLPEIRAKIKQLRRQLDRYIEGQGTPDSVYHLSISFYPVTKESSSF
jgi:transcriptional regulator with XRE-family HTH domain